MRFKLKYYGTVIIFIGLIFLVPLAVLPFYPREWKYALSFVITAAISAVVGMIVCIIPHRSVRIDWENPFERGSLPVLLIWSYGFVIGALPFIFGDILPPVRALFESVSGWTTTGLTTVDPEATPHIFLFFRSYMQFCGGLGFILIFSSIMRDKKTVNLYNAEGHPDKLLPNLRRTSRVIILLYLMFLAVGVIFYVIFGMNPFDAICHTMSALSTAGYSTKAASIGQYASFPIELITVVLMLVGSVNFGILLLIVRGNFKKVAKITEMRFMAGMLAVFVPLIAFSLIIQAHMGILQSFRDALFGAVTIFSTTGYSIANYAEFPPFASVLIMLLMIIGGGIGSTAGGIKLSRTYLLLRFTTENIRKHLSSSRKITLLSVHRIHGRDFVDAAFIADTLGFIACYISIAVIGTMMLTLTADCPVYDAMFEFTSALGTVGVSCGVTDAHANAGTLIVEMAGMILGRLEIYVVLAGALSGAKTIGKITGIRK